MTMIEPRVRCLVDVQELYKLDHAVVRALW
jgi:hypothetical protein